MTRTLIYEGLATRIEEDWEAGAAFFSQVLDAATAAADLWLEGWTAQALSRIRLRQGDLAESERLFQHARRLRQQSGETQNLVSDLAWLGRLRLAQGRPAEALRETAVAVQQIEAAQVRYGRLFNRNRIMGLIPLPAFHPQNHSFFILYNCSER